MRRQAITPSSVGLAVDQKAPDHATLTVLRERLIQRGKQKVFEEILEEIV